jgi:hypothetical protein
MPNRLHVGAERLTIYLRKRINLTKDPFEQQDLAISQPQELRRMMQGLFSALDRQHAVYPIGEDGVTPLKPELP